MKLKDTREEYYFYSGKVSDIVRQLGLSGLAVIWIFKIENGQDKIIPSVLLPAGLFLLLGLTADLFQYAAGTVIWDRFNRKKEEELGKKQRELIAEGNMFDPEEGDFTAPSSINNVTKWLFWMKITFVLIAYIFLVGYLIIRVARVS